MNNMELVTVQINSTAPDLNRSVAYSVELVVLNKHQISGGGAYLDCYRIIIHSLHYLYTVSI